MTPHRKSSSTSLIAAVLVLALCILIGAITAILINVPRSAARLFGPPAAGLSTYQKTIYSFRLLSNQAALNTPLDSSASSQPFTINAGESVNSIALRLEQAGLVADAQLFRYYLIYSGIDTSIQAGKYQLSAANTAVEIAQSLQDATSDEVAFVILPGWRAEEIAAVLPTSGLTISERRFLQMVESPDVSFPPGLNNLDALEGYLLPGVYVFKRDVSVEAFIYQLLFQFDELVVDDLRNRYVRQGLSLQEAVILASIVQREAVIEDEQPMIASVFFNRLANGMKLDSDPTVQYAVARPGNWWPNPLTLKDLRTDSVYNTYLYPGLPPGPICNPGLSALRAVAYPADSPYLFFRARCDGSGLHSFARTYQEHLDNACP